MRYFRTAWLFSSSDRMKCVAPTISAPPFCSRCSASIPAPFAESSCVKSR